MKICKIILIVSILCTVLSVCSNSENKGGSSKGYPWDIGRENEWTVEEDGKIIIDLIPDSLSAGGASFILKNEGAEEVSYGSPYCLQIHIDGEWRQIEKERDWTAEMQTLLAGKEETVSVNWENLYGLLPAGEYRLVKAFTIESETVYVACPFVISEQEAAL